MPSSTASSTPGAIHLFVFHSPCFNFCFCFLWNHATGLPEALHSHLCSFRILEPQHLCFPILNHCPPMLTPVMKMVTRQMKAQLRKNSLSFQEPQMAHSFDILQSILLTFLMKCGF